MKGAKLDVRLIGASAKNEVLQWVNSAYVVHNDMKSQTGQCQSFGCEAVQEKSSI